MLVVDLQYKWQHYLNKELDLLLENEEILWAQKSRLNWLALRDTNTNFFHLYTRMRRSINRIDRIHDGSQWIVGHEQISNHVFQTFSRLFNPEPTENHQYHITSFLGSWKKFLSEDEVNQISRPFKAHEVHSAMFQIGANKAPGPDEIPTVF